MPCECEGAPRRSVRRRTRILRSGGGWEGAGCSLSHGRQLQPNAPAVPLDANPSSWMWIVRAGLCGLKSGVVDFLNGRRRGRSLIFGYPRSSDNIPERFDRLVETAGGARPPVSPKGVGGVSLWGGMGEWGAGGGWGGGNSEGPNSTGQAIRLMVLASGDFISVWPGDNSVHNLLVLVDSRPLIERSFRSRVWFTICAQHCCPLSPCFAVLCRCLECLAGQLCRWTTLQA